MKLKNLLSWLDEHILLILSGFLLVFIPLWPKIPLFSIIEQYIVRVRLEDIFIFFTFVVWGIQLLRGKASIKTPTSKGIGAYLGIGLLSVLSAAFIIRTVPLEPLHLGKTVLHYLRNIEYFSLFFIVFSAVKKKSHVKVLMATVIFTVVAVSIYGFGQKYLYWPVYSTMNREFSKGIRLYLTEHARVQSTFAGHYDLGAYLVIALPLVLALGLSVKNKALKAFLYFSHWLGLWLLIVSASRSSFGSYLAAVTLVITLFASKKKKLWQKIKWWVPRYLVLLLVISQTFSMFGEDIYERFLQQLQAFPEVHDTFHAWNDQRKTFFKETILAPLGLEDGLFNAKKPENGISTDEAAKIILDSDTRPTPVKPADVYVEVPDQVVVATQSATGETSLTTIERPRTYSENARRFGLSLAIRLDTLWPQAIEGFQKNPLLGSGYATLNKRSFQHFTEADSTDNNFLRTLGETGLLGFITFYGTILVLLGLAVKRVRSDDEMMRALAIGYIGGTVGLLLNATYIDVFAASKVAQTFWALTGIFTAYLVISKPKPKLSSAQVAKLPISEITTSAKKTAKKGVKKTKKTPKPKK